MEQSIEQNLQTVTRLVDTLVEFAVAYGFQILGALFFLVVGIKLASWCGARIARLAEARNIDATLAKFLGNLVRIVLLAFVVVITLGNFGISIAPLIALAGASAFGATLAIQGPLSNYGAGLSIILARPFTVGNTITVQGASGVVETVTLAHTVLIGEDGERITVPNKEIVGRVIVNSHQRRVVETRIAIAAGVDADRAVAAIEAALGGVEGVAADPAPQVGVHGFTYGGVVLGARFWVPSRHYFQTRYTANRAVLAALDEAGVAFMPALPAAMAAPALDDEPVADELSV